MSDLKTALSRALDYDYGTGNDGAAAEAADEDAERILAHPAMQEIAEKVALADAVESLNGTGRGWGIMKNPGDPVYYVDIAGIKADDEAAPTTLLEAIEEATR